jgi:superfamily II helicase
MITRFNPEKGLNEVVYTKVCFACKKEKDLADFNRQKGGKWGRKHVCRDCHHKQERERYLKNSYAIINRNKRWANRNNEKMKKYKRDYYHRNKKGAAKPITPEDLL